MFPRLMLHPSRSDDEWRSISQCGEDIENLRTNGAQVVCRAARR